jgi:hypothetical protein
MKVGLVAAEVAAEAARAAVLGVEVEVALIQVLAAMALNTDK